MPLFENYCDPVTAGSAMVAAAHPLAATVGLNILKIGGNAMDACLAMAGVTMVVLPQMCGLGGDAFFIYYEAKTRTAVAVNGSGPAGDQATVHQFKDKGRILPQDGIYSIAVPGAPMVYDSAERRFSVLGLEKCFEPAVMIAEKGFPVSTGLSHSMHLELTKLTKYEEARKVLLSGGKPLSEGEIMKRPDLARTLKEFARGGAGYFYDGPFAREFYKLAEEMGGLFSGYEFSRYLEEDGGETYFYTPIKTSYRGYDVLQTAPVSQGFLVLEELNILENFDLPSMEPGSADTIHLMIEAKKIAFRDRNVHAGDPRFCDFDVNKFISKEYAKSAASLISMDCTRDYNDCRRYNEGDTTSFVAWDSEGNVCSFIHSLGFSFGSGVMVPGTGVLMNNRAGRSFVLDENHPNSLMPGRRPIHTLNCYMIMRNGMPYIIGGTPGGDGQSQWNMQMISLMLDHGASPQDAVDFPRWLSSPGTDVINLDKPSTVTVESRISADTTRSLGSRGHVVRVGGEWTCGGGGQIIKKDPVSGILLGGSDKRVAGMAVGY